MITVNATDLPRFMQCNGSRLMNSIKSDASNPNKEAGNAAHYVALTVWNGERKHADELVDQKAPNGVFITSEMADHVDDYLAIIDCGSSVISEAMEVDTSFSGQGWSVPARADHICLTDDATLRITDFKYGFTIVEPEENWTLIAHAIGFCIKNQVKPDVIVFAIFQPRPYHPDGKFREWRTTYEELLVKFAELSAKLSNPSDMLQTGPNCHYCPSMPFCGAARKAGLNSIEAADFVFHEDLPNEELIYEFDNLTRAKAMIKDRLDALEELLKFKTRNGELTDGFSVEPSVGNLRWKENINAEVLKIITGKDLSKYGMVTPTQAMSKFKIPETVIMPFAERPPTGLKLIRESADDKAKRLFNQQEKTK
jgi:hypothetical protein